MMPFLAVLLTAQTYPPAATFEEVRARLEAAPKAHPRLLATAPELAGLRAARTAGPLRRAIAEAAVAAADRVLDLEPLSRRMQGRRLLGVSREALFRVTSLAAARHVTGDDRYARRAESEMLAAARFADWNPAHFLDTAEMTFALALGYDWLHDRLDPAARREIRDAIVSKGVAVPFTGKHDGWKKARNNWGQVCHGGMVAGALAVLEDEPELAARTVHDAIRYATFAMEAYAPRGSYPEGPGYWCYGTSYNVVLLSALQTALGTDFGLSRAPGFAQTGGFPDLACGPSGLFFNYSDGGAARHAQSFRFWLSSRFDRPDWTASEARVLLKDVPAASRDRFFALGLLWAPADAPDMPPRLPLHWNGGGDVPVTVHRSSWTGADAVFVGLKGGSPSANHGHMDVGSFVLDADGMRWAVDLGAEGYHGVESRGMNLWDRRQTSDRWKIFRQGNEGHNTLLIDGAPQRVAGSGRVASFSDDPAFPHTVLDMSGVYEGQAASVRRGVALLPSREVLIQDRLTGLAPGTRVRWGMITPGTPDKPGRSVLRLRQGQVRLELSAVAPSGAAWKLVDTAASRNEWDSPNPGTVMAALEVSAPDSGELVITVLATPGSCTDSVRDGPPPPPLEAWGR